MKEQLNALLQKRWTLPTATGVVGVGVGTLVGYMLTKKQYDRIEAEIARVDAETDQYTLDFRDAALAAEVEKRVAVELERRMPHILRQLEYSTETEVDEDALQALREDHPASRSNVRQIRPIGPDTVIGRTVDVRETPEGIEVEGTLTQDGVRVMHRVEENERRAAVRRTTSIFDGAGDEWDYKTEIENRNPERPYVIHVDEYMTDEMGWDSQSTLTWYDKDQILCDSHDHPIHNPNVIVGMPIRFGHGSNDPNVVYVRNEVLKAEYEILRDSGSYQEIVLGEQLEAAAESEHLRHSHQMRFRGD